MRERSHIIGEEAIKAGCPTARRWYSSSALEGSDSASTPGCGLPEALLLSLLNSRARGLGQGLTIKKKPSSPIMLWNRKMLILSLFWHLSSWWALVPTFAECKMRIELTSQAKKHLFPKRKHSQISEFHLGSLFKMHITMPMPDPLNENVLAQNLGVCISASTPPHQTFLSWFFLNSLKLKKLSLFCD